VPREAQRVLTFLLHAQKKVTKEKGSTNAAPLPAASRLPAAHARVGRSVRARPRAQVSFNE
ncbi:MAG: hypothetical protein ACKO96_34070, partial [Flammeovirgaceae bacterium]